MTRTNVFFKVEIDHDSRAELEKIAEQIARQIMKLYGVRAAEIASINPLDE